MTRRLPPQSPVRKPDGDGELLRMLGSAANEIVEALDLPAAKVTVGLSRVVTRYAKVLRINTRILHEAVQEARNMLKEVSRVPSTASSRAKAIAPADAVADAAAPPTPA